MRDYLVAIPVGTARRYVSDLSLPELQLCLDKLATGEVDNDGTQCSTETFAERVRIELIARQLA